MGVHRLGQLDTTEDPSFERKQWVAERIAWVLLMLTIVAGLLGAFGNGLLARAHVASADGRLKIDYPRLARRESNVDLEVQATVDPGQDLVITIDERFVEGISLVTVIPEPKEQRLDPDGLVLTYETTGKGGTMDVEVRYKPERWGSTAATVGIAGGETVVLHQWVYP